MSKLAIFNQQPTFLTIIIDVNPVAWQKRGEQGTTEQITLNDMIKSIVVFANAYTMMNRNNKLLVLGNHPLGVKRIFPDIQAMSPEMITTFSKHQNDMFIPVPTELSWTLAQNLLTVTAISSLNGEDIKYDDETDESECKYTLANALSVALCG